MTNTKNQDDCLYISFTEPKTKRKYILKNIKNSLEIQENILKLKEIRKTKVSLYKTIKKEMEALEDINTRLRATFPNPKEVLPTLETESENIQQDIEKLLPEEIKKQRKKEARHQKHKKETKEAEEKETQKNQQKKQEETHKEFQKNNTKKLSKLDRIKNNISLIEEELKKVK